MVNRVIELRKVRSLDQVLSTAFLLLRSEFKSLLKSLLIIAGPWMLAIGLSAGVFWMSGNIFSDIGLSFIAPAIILLISFVAALFLITTPYAFVVLYVRAGGVAPSLGEVWHKTLKSLPRMLGTVVALIVISWLLQFSLLAIAGIGFGFLLNSLVFALLFGFALLAFLAYFVVHFTFIFIIRMQEPVGLLDSIGRSFDLVRGYWWQTFGVLFLTYIMLVIITYATAILPYLAIAIQDSFTPNSNSGALSIVLGIAWAALSLFVFLVAFTLFNIVIAVQYYNLVERKEAPGLHERIDKLDSNMPEMPQ